MNGVSPMRLKPTRNLKNADAIIKNIYFIFILGHSHETIMKNLYIHPMLVNSYRIKGVVHCHWCAPMPDGGLESFAEISN
jgi:hypothetical protein